MNLSGSARLAGAEGSELGMNLGCAGDVEVTGGGVGGALAINMAVTGGVYFDTYEYRNFGMSFDVSSDVDVYDAEGRLKWEDDPDLGGEGDEHE